MQPESVPSVAPTGRITREDYLSGGAPVPFIELTPDQEKDLMLLTGQPEFLRVLKSCMTAEELAAIERKNQESELRLDLVRYELLKTMTPEEVYGRVRLSIISGIKKKYSFVSPENGDPLAHVMRADLLEFMKDAAKYDDDIAAAFKTATQESKK